jgi:hypothetical protein
MLPDRRESLRVRMRVDPPAMATQQSTRNPEFERGLPSNVYAERMVLGAVLMNDSAFVTVASGLAPDDFSLEKHRASSSACSIFTGATSASTA